MRRTPTHLRPIRRAAAALATLALATGCASAGKRYEQGVQLEQSGRPADAAQRYIDALKKDRTLADARTRLSEAGTRAIAGYLDEAGRFESVGSYVEAADVLRRLDDLRGDAGAVGVPLQPPVGYEQRRRATFDRAVDLAMSASANALARRDYSAAIGWLERASQRWEPTPADRGRLTGARYDALYGWAQGEMQSGRYRAAYERAAQAAALGRYETGGAAELQAEALRLGTVRVAILPVTGRGQVRDSLPDDLFAELNDELVLNHWNRPPLWLDVVDPVAAGREARRSGGGPRQPIGPAAAAQVGRRLGARMVVVMELDSVRRGETGVTTQRRAARTQAGADTAFTVREGRVETWARVTWHVVDGWGRMTEEGTADARSTARFRQADYHGDWRTLQLSLADRTLFASGGRGYTRETVRELVSGLSTRLGRDVYDAVLRRVE